MSYNQEFSFDFLSKSSPTQYQIKPRTDIYSISKIPSSNNNNNIKSSANLSHVPCKFFKQGTCTAGANCTFSHSSDLSSESAVCKYFLKGNCKFGTKCALLHTMSLLNNKSSNNNRPIAMTPPNPSSFIDYQPMIFGTSAPLRSTNDYSMDYLLGTSPFSQKVMLPSSLTNDLFLPNEMTNNRVPFYQHKPEKYSNNNDDDDDEVQFYMEDDAFEDHKILSMAHHHNDNDDIFF